MTLSMSKPLGPIFAVAILVISMSSAIAQDTPSGPDALSETYRDWIVQCRSVPAQDGQPGPRLCEMTQELRQQDDGQRVLSVALSVTENESAALLTMVTPFGLKVSGQVAIEIDGATVLETPFQTCLPAGCIVQAQFAQTVLDAMSGGETAVVSLPTTNGEAFQVSISLLGFSMAWHRLGEL